MKWKAGLSVAVIAVVSVYIWATGVTVIHFRREDIAAGYTTVCLQKSSAVPDQDDSRYGCPTSSGLHLWAGQDYYIFLHDGAEGDFTLVCTDGDRRSIQHFGYYTGGTGSEIWHLETACNPLPVR